MVLPEVMCDKHLLGEHLESHMLHGCLKKGKNLKGYIEGGLVELHNLDTRHKALVKEMEARGFKHRSPLELRARLPKMGEVDSRESLKELVSRCHECARKTAIWFIDGLER